MSNERSNSVHNMALAAAEGIGVPQDWGAALDLARQAAHMGHSLAQSSLAALAGDWSMAERLLQGESVSADWDRLRSAVDIGAWLRAPGPKILSVAPRVALVEGIASPELCDWLIERARPNLEPAQVYDPGSGRHAHDSVRTNTERFFAHWERDLVFAFLRARFAAATELPVSMMEGPTILHYLPGQEFKPHHDYLNIDLPGYAKEVEMHGQRVLTLLLCLNDDYEGGETHFPALGRRFRGRKGNALFFWNVEPDGTIDPATLHAGLPPTRGEKWLLSQWIRSRPWLDSITPVP